MYFYKLKSHQDSLLVDHLKFVGDRGAILIENKSINFKYSKGQLQHTAKVIGYCHDLGKGTKYFQDYLLGKNSVKDKLKAHAFLSSLICFYNVKEINEELAIISYLCVKHHHGNLKNFANGRKACGGYIKTATRAANSFRLYTPIILENRKISSRIIS